MFFFLLCDQGKIDRRLIDLFNPLTFKDWNLTSKLGFYGIYETKGKSQKTALATADFDSCLLAEL